jgi:hypothetical protein
MTRVAQDVQEGQEAEVIRDMHSSIFIHLSLLGYLNYLRYLIYLGYLHIQEYSKAVDSRTRNFHRPARWTERKQTRPPATTPMWHLKRDTA